MQSDDFGTKIADFGNQINDLGAKIEVYGTKIEKIVTAIVHLDFGTVGLGAQIDDLDVKSSTSALQSLI